MYTVTVHLLAVRPDLALHSDRGWRRGVHGFSRRWRLRRRRIFRLRRVLL